MEDDKNDDDSGSGPHGHLYNFSDDSGLAGLKSKTDQDMGIMFGRNGSSVVSGTDRFYGIVYRGGVSGASNDHGRRSCFIWRWFRHWERVGSLSALSVWPSARCGPAGIFLAEPGNRNRGRLLFSGKRSAPGAGR